MKTNITVDGLLDLDRALKDLADQTSSRTSRAVVRRVLTKAAAPIAVTMKSLAPPHVKPEIVITEKLTPEEKRRAKEAEEDPVVTVHVGPNYERGSRARTAHLFEFGTVFRRQESTGRPTGRMKITPFMRPAWDENKNKALIIISQQLWIEIKKTAERAARKAERTAAKLRGN